MSSIRERHNHKYMRVDISTNKAEPYNVYRCMDSDCPKPGHYLPAALVVGLKTICWSCEKPVVMSALMATKKKPICSDCKVAANPDMLSALDEVMSGVAMGTVGKNDEKNNGEEE